MSDFDTEAISTRRVLERVPDDKATWKPHDKSFALNNMAVHVATLPMFGLALLILTHGDGGHHDTTSSRSTNFTTAEKLVEVAAGAGGRSAHQAGIDDRRRTASGTWTLRFGEHVIATGTKHLLYRTMFFNHLIHHRGQLNVYLRLLDVKVPGIYGPSADEPFGS